MIIDILLWLAHGPSSIRLLISALYPFRYIFINESNSFGRVDVSAKCSNVDADFFSTELCILSPVSSSFPVHIRQCSWSPSIALEWGKIVGLRLSDSMGAVNALLCVRVEGHKFCCESKGEKIRGRGLAIINLSQSS